MNINFSGDIPLVVIVEALASGGISLKNDGEGGLRAEPSPELALLLRHTPSAPRKIEADDPHWYL